MTHPKTNKIGFSTHYLMSNNNKTFTLLARFHPDDKYWLYISNDGEFDGIIEGESFINKTYTILDQWYDADHWYDEVSYKLPKKPIEYHEYDF